MRDALITLREDKRSAVNGTCGSNYPLPSTN